MARLHVPNSGDVTAEADQFPRVRVRTTVVFAPIAAGTRITEHMRIEAPRPIAAMTVREAVKAHTAMLAGMRTAFESMLAEFDPEQLQKEFDRQLAKGLVPAKLRYWDLFREKQQAILKDPEASFRRLPTS